MSLSASCKIAAASLTCLGVLAVDGAAAAPDAPPIMWTATSVMPAGGQPRGFLQFQAACSVCHGAGPAKPGTRALAAKYRGSEPALLEQRQDLAPDLVRTIIRQGITVMPPFRKTELSDADLDAIVAYLTRKRR